MKYLLKLVVLIFILQSCGDKTQTGNHLTPEENTTIPVEFTSPLKPGEKLELGKTYTDIVKYIRFDDNGDEWLVVVEKNKDTVTLVYNKEFSDFFKGEEIEIQWKMDSIRYAGDPDFLNYAEFFISAKRLKTLALTDRKIKILWRETHFDEELKADISAIKLNESYINTISEPEKAALGYVATFIGNECEWDGKANESRSNLKCKILSALNLGYQCSYHHLDFLRFWFRNNKEILKELESCPTTPDGATIQDTFDEIEIEVQGNKITVFFKANGINMREQQKWSWTEKQFFEFKTNELVLIKKDISTVEHSKFEISAD